MFRDALDLPLIWVVDALHSLRRWRLHLNGLKLARQKGRSQSQLREAGPTRYAFLP